jgi:HNH endonuclease
VSLRSLPDFQILSRIQELTRQEREVTLQVLLHLNEIERRKLHLKLGHQSMFDYCTSGLGYSASAAVRRIKTARCVVRFPRVLDLLQKNELNLSVVAQVSPVLTDVNHHELLGRVRGKTQREVEAILAEYQPGAMPRDRVRTVVVRVPVSTALARRSSHAAPLAPAGVTVGSLASVSKSPQAEGACEKSAYNRNGGKLLTTPTCSAAMEAERFEKRIMLQFAVHPEFMAKLDKIKSLVWHRLPANASLEQIFELLMDRLIEREEPAKRIERREKRTKPATRAARSPAVDGARHVPAALRDRIVQRDGGRCAFVGAGGRRCNATRALQVDHIVPVARGGRSTPDNLRLLCAHHNRLEAERVLGAAVARARVGSNSVDLTGPGPPPN